MFLTGLFVRRLSVLCRHHHQVAKVLDPGPDVLAFAAEERRDLRYFDGRDRDMLRHRERVRVDLRAVRAAHLDRVDLRARVSEITYGLKRDITFLTIPFVAGHRIDRGGRGDQSATMRAA